MNSENGEMKSTKSDFIRQQIDADVASGKHGGRVQTRFPPEPNGFLHIGHAKAICVNFGIAEEYGGKCNLRFDDTNPTREDVSYVEAIKNDIQWLGYEWDNLHFASDYFEQLYEWAVGLIKAGKAYIDDSSPEAIREARGTFTELGTNSPYRERSIEENLDLFARMRAGEFPNGARVLRAKIDMSSPNINLRDPILYRIMHVEHHRTGDEWCIYPMYDWAHGQSDSIEQVTHSLCSLEFTNHRPLYNWLIQELDIFPPQQMEFARLKLSHTVVSKRKLLRLIEAGIVDGWDDPRMPTLSAVRRRGYPASAIRKFIDQVGLAKSHNVVALAQLEAAVRDELNQSTSRVMAILKPLKLVITNYPEGQTEAFELPNYPQDKERTESRQVAFSRELYIEQEDFAEVPPPKWKRLTIGATVRLLGSYFVTADSVVKDDDGNVLEVHCTYLPETRGGFRTEGTPKPKGTIHWVSAEHSLPATVRLYETLFLKTEPEKDEKEGDLTDSVNPNSLEVLATARVEMSLEETSPGERYQFMRMGYFATDQDSEKDNLIFNRTVPLRDTWAN